VCDANSGLINLGGSVVIDTQSDLAHAWQMIEMFSTVWPAMPKRFINTHEGGDHVWVINFLMALRSSSTGRYPKG
jgi:cyclase